MRKIHVGDDSGLEETTKEIESVNNIDDLRTKLSTMNVMADITSHTDRRAKVVVRENVGTSLYFSSITDDVFWLNRNARRKERKGDCTVYYFTFN